VTEFDQQELKFGEWYHVCCYNLYRTHIFYIY